MSERCTFSNQFFGRGETREEEHTEIRIDAFPSSSPFQGVQLSTEREAGRFVFVAPPASLQELFALLSSVLESGSLLLLDDLSSLLWAGHSATTTAGFFKRVQTLVYGDQVRPCCCSGSSGSSIQSRGKPDLTIELNSMTQVKGSLIVLLHGDELVAAGTADDDVLFRKVLQTSDLWLETKSLSSQTRGEVRPCSLPSLVISWLLTNERARTQLSIHRAPALVDDFGVGERSGRTAWEYKLEEAGAVFSVKGLGKGFL